MVQFVCVSHSACVCVCLNAFVLYCVMCVLQCGSIHLCVPHSVVFLCFVQFNVCFVYLKLQTIWVAHFSFRFFSLFAFLFVK